MAIHCNLWIISCANQFTVIGQHSPGDYLTLIDSALNSSQLITIQWTSRVVRSIIQSDLIISVGSSGERVLSLCICDRRSSQLAIYIIQVNCYTTYANLMSIEFPISVGIIEHYSVHGIGWNIRSKAVTRISPTYGLIHIRQYAQQ